MIKFLVLVNKQGQTRLARYYEDLVDVTGEERAVQVREGGGACALLRVPHCCAPAAGCLCGAAGVTCSVWTGRLRRRRTLCASA